MKTDSTIALCTLATLCVAICGLSRAATNAPAPAAATNAAATNAVAPVVDEGPAITGKVLALRDKDGTFSSVKLLADYAVYHVNLDDKAKELATTARFKMVKAHGSVVEEKPVGSAPPRKVLTLTSFTVVEPAPDVFALTNAPAATNQAAVTNVPAATNAPAPKP